MKDYKNYWSVKRIVNQFRDADNPSCDEANFRTLLQAGNLELNNEDVQESLQNLEKRGHIALIKTSATYDGYPIK